jgi:anti-sigma regulatory factor (Ser/Thr protein kinase)
LGADTKSAGTARRFLIDTLAGWDASSYGDDAVLLLSELVANAALHARTRMAVRIELRAESLRLSVTDSSPVQPSLRHYSKEATTGRGLALVDRLAQRWGVDPNADGSKTVWAVLGADPARRRGDGVVADGQQGPGRRAPQTRAKPGGAPKALNLSWAV